MAHFKEVIIDDLNIINDKARTGHSTVISVRSVMFIYTPTGHVGSCRVISGHIGSCRAI